MQDKIELSHFSKVTRVTPNTATRIIQRYYFIYKNNNFNFEQTIRLLQKASFLEVKNGAYDAIIEKCLKFCSLTTDRHRLHQLVYTLFSGNKSGGLFFRQDSIYRRILSYLLYDNESDFPTLIRVLKDTFNEWKSTAQRQREPISLDVQTLTHVLLDVNSTLKTTSGPVGLEQVDAWKLATIEKTLVRYIPSESQLLQEFSRIKQKIEACSANSQEILQFFKAIQNHIKQENPKTFGIVPQNTPSFSDHSDPFRNDLVNASHGGGLFFLSGFFYGRNKGYLLNDEEGGFGLYVDPYPGDATNYGDNYYALRNPVKNFDISVSLKCNIEGSHLQKSERNTNEAILRYTNRNKISITDISIIQKQNYPMIGLLSLHPSNLEKVYPSEQDIEIRIQICKSMLRLSSKDDYPSWAQQLSSLSIESSKQYKK